METLHTILLGPYKYLLRSLMGRLTVSQIKARLSTFDFSGLDYKMSYNITRHFRSFVGRDFKALAQVSLFLLGQYMTPQEKPVWLALGKVNGKIIQQSYTDSQVFRIAYCQRLRLSKIDEARKACKDFVDLVRDCFPQLQKKVKIHLILHLTESMIDLGPTSTFNTERYAIPFMQ